MNKLEHKISDELQSEIDHETINHLIVKNTINDHTYIVDQWLLDALDDEYKKGTYSSRKNVDALALEITLRYKGKLETLEKLPNEKYQWRHDWAVADDFLIDLKRRPQWSNNYCISSSGKLQESYKMGQLTHVVGFTQNIENDYKLGDKLTFKCEGILPVDDVIRIAEDKGSFCLLNKNKFY